MSFIRKATVVETARELYRGAEKLFLVQSDGAPGLDGKHVKHLPVTTATAAATAAKTTTSAEPAANTLVAVKFTNGNSAASPTVAFAGGAARAVQLGGAAPLNTEITIGNNGVAMFWFDGTILHQLGVYV